MLYPEVVITGELANFRISKNAWVYFDLKDEFSTVKFFGSVRSLPGPLEEGMMLEVVARPQLHAQYGFSLNILSVGVVGVGSLNKAYMLLLKKLEREGLFDPARKRPLPYAPKKIGLITSSESAAYGDFIKIINKRWPALDIALFDVQVQGREAPEQIIAAVNQANQQTDLEALVIVRGGGSKDDLASFDHEAVVRAVAASRIPTLVAIGHERDVALSEMAADARASTPSNAAELLVPDREAEQAALNSTKNYLDGLLMRFRDGLAEEIDSYRQDLDNLVKLKLNAAKLYSLHTRELVAAIDPLKPLDRGYALVKDSHKQLIRSKAAAASQPDLLLIFKDGEIKVKTEKQK